MYHKNNGKTIDDAEDLDLVMPICNMLEYTPSYSDATGSLWLKMKQLILIIILRARTFFKLFKYNARLLGNTEADIANEILNITNYNK